MRKLFAVVVSHQGLHTHFPNAFIEGAQESIGVPGPFTGSVEFITGRLTKRVDLTAWDIGSNDIVYGK